MPVTAKKSSESRQSTGRKTRMGRPPVAPETARSNRVVTFVTNSEMESLERIASEEDKSLSAAVHQILARSLDRSRP